MKFDQVLSQLSETFGVNQNNVNQANTTNVNNNQNNKTTTPATTNPPQQNKPTTTPVNNQKLDIKNPVVAELVKAQKPEEVLAALTKLGLTTNK